jgi:hypothetical protein
VKAGRNCTVVLDVADAVAVGYSLQAVARGDKMPAATRVIYDRVGSQLVSAARAEAMDASNELMAKVRGVGGVL